PLARRLAEENGIDWRRLKGTGPDGTIVERDILAFLAKVMAGEVDLPPMPESPPPLPPAEELKRAQAALEREGVDLAELIPEAPKTPTLQVEEVPEEELALDFPEIDLLDEEPLFLPEEEEALEAWEEDLLERPLPEPRQEELQEAAQEAPEPEAPPALEEALPTQEIPPGPLLGVAPVPAPAQSAPLRVFRRKVDQTRLG
ncbi:E3 binding domain-containing protein, partial [Thermus aquaticus]|uniref:E3 binding domain-containing protein n=1 Tax=Thermus aquaticus TaxID=271 RepID=UPI000A92E03A